MGKLCLHASSFIFDQIIIKVAGNQDRHKSSVEFEFRPNQTTHFGVTCKDRIIIKVAGNQDRHKSLISGGIRILTLELLALEWWKFHTFELEYLWSQLATLDQILCVASLGWGKGCIRFWDRLDQNSGFHGNRKPPLTYNGENDVSAFSCLFFIRSLLYLQVTRTWIKSQTSSNFGQIGPLTTELAALEV